jgi:hypothetical protein
VINKLYLRTANHCFLRLREMLQKVKLEELDLVTRIQFTGSSATTEKLRVLAFLQTSAKTGLQLVLKKASDCKDISITKYFSKRLMQLKSSKTNRERSLKFILTTK